MTINGQVDGALVALTPLRGSAPLLGGSPLPPPTVPTARPMDTPSDELVAWLAVAASALPSEPAVVAERFLIAADDARLGEALLARARALAGDAKLAAPGLVEAAVALYLRALRAMLLVEEARLGGVGFAAALLRAEPFHAALLACAAECVARAHGLGEAAGLGPLLDARKVSPYDLLKVLDFFVRVEAPPAALRRHLHAAESRLLDSRVWESGSPVVALIEQAAAASAAEAGSAPASDEPAAAAAPLPPPPGGDKSLQLFWAKLLYLAALRLHALCCELRLPHSLLHESWRVLKAVYARRPRLAQDRHLDQLTLCAVYGVCKAAGVSSTFRQIVESYKRLAHATHAVFRDVSMVPLAPPASGAEGVVAIAAAAPAAAEGAPAPPPPRGDIISFYNAIFIPNTKTLLLTPAGSTPAEGVGGAAACAADALVLHGRAAAAPASRNATPAGVDAPPPARVPSAPPHPSELPTVHGARVGAHMPAGTHAERDAARSTGSPSRAAAAAGVGGGGVYAYQQHPTTPNPTTASALTPRTRVLYSFGHSPALELTRINRRVNGMADTPPHSMHPMLSAAVKRGAAAVSAALADSPLRAASVGGKRGRYNGDDDDDDEELDRPALAVGQLRAAGAAGAGSGGDDDGDDDNAPSDSDDGEMDSDPQSDDGEEPDGDELLD